ncbi:MAG: NAD-dependent epimerase/dehydratase family protein, partial [Salinibacterium sp.]
MRIIVTGAAGCLGTELCLQLRARGDAVLGVDNLSRYELLGEDGPRKQSANAEALRAAGVEFEKDDFVDALGADRIYAYDAVVHAAAQVCHSRKGGKDDPFDDVRINVMGTLQLLDRTQSAGKPLLFIGSSKVYGENFDRMNALQAFNGIDESCPLGDQTHITFFGASKAAADLFCQMYAKKYGMAVGVFRPGCFTGRYALATEAQNWLPWLAHCAREGKVFRAFGDGKQVRDLLHASDLARACIMWLNAPRPGVWNLGGGRSTAFTLYESIERVEKLVGKHVNVGYHPARAGDIRRLVLDSTRFVREYDWAPLYDVN